MALKILKSILSTKQILGESVRCILLHMEASDPITVGEFPRVNELWLTSLISLSASAITVSVPYCLRMRFATTAYVLIVPLWLLELFGHRTSPNIIAKKGETSHKFFGEPSFGTLLNP